MKTYLLILSLLLFIGCTSEEMIQPEPDQAVLADQSLTKSSRTRGAAFPNIIPLPDGFSPEGIASGSGTDFYVGSLADGSIYKGNYRDGSGSIFVTGSPGQLAVGLDYDERTKFLYVSGGFGFSPTRIINENGAMLASLTFNSSGFTNDVIVTKDAAYFTDSFAPVFYKIDLNEDGTLPDPVEFETMALSGDFMFISDPGAFNGNGIVATPNGKKLIIVNAATGRLYLVDPDTGYADLIEGVSVPSGDGLILLGKDLYVVQNFLNQIAVVRLAPDYSSGEITDVITSPDFRIPTTAAEFGSSLYAVNARFDVAPPGEPNEVEFEVVKVDRN